MIPMNNALIGYSGFVGGTLLKQTMFSKLFRSNNIAEIEGKHFDTVVCSAASAKKWLANKEPATDKASIDILIRYLETIKCKKFILISTVDVFKQPKNVDETSPVEEIGLHPYGLHRRFLEKFVQTNFSQHLIVRLPGLVGTKLQKNIIYDFLNKNNIETIESRGVFQFYPMVNLWYDIQIAIQNSLRLIHLTSEPISIREVASQGFGYTFEQELSGIPAFYNMQTCYAHLFNTQGNYQYNKRETIQAIRAYAQSEPITLNSNLEK